MRTRKARLTVTVDGSLLAAASDAVRDGRASSVSAWVNLALEQHAARDRRLRAMADAVAAYESAHGLISDEEMESQRRRDRGKAILIESAPQKRRRKKSGEGGGAGSAA